MTHSDARGEVEVLAPAWIFEELHPAPAAEEVFHKLSTLPHCLYLDSARRDRELGRYSFVTADPFEYFESPVSSHTEDSLADLGRRMAAFSSATIAGLPPFQGGAAGLLSYDFAHRLERLPSARQDEFNVPAMAIGLYDVVVAFDHFADRAWIISQGFPEREPILRRRRAVQRAELFRKWLETPLANAEARSSILHGVRSACVRMTSWQSNIAVPHRLSEPPTDRG